MKRIVLAAALASLAVAGCKKAPQPEQTDVLAPPRPAGDLTPAGGEVTEVPAAGEPAHATEPATLPPRVPPTTTPPPTAAEAPPKPEVITYTVKRGDRLWSLAVRFYGDGRQWKKIAEANDITDETKLPVGKVLVIP